MDPRARIAVLVLALAAVGAAVVLAGGGKPAVETPRGFATGTTTPNLGPGCIEEPPAEVARPAWFPRDLPLPKGSYIHDVPEELAPGIDVAQLYMPASLDDFVALVLGEWEDAGWKPGIGEREPGEAEDTFVGPDGIYGQFRAQSVYCETAATNLYIAFAKRDDTQGGS